MFYRIKTNLTKEQSEKIVDSLTPIEVERLESYKLKAYDEEIEGQINSYIISDRYVFTRILLFLRQKSIDFEYEDISESVLTGDISFRDTNFENEVNEFIINNIIYKPRPHQSPLTTRPLDQKKSQPTGSESDQSGLETL